MIHHQPDEQRFALNIPFYVNGSLDDDEHTWMELYLAKHPEWQISVQHAQHHRAYSQSIRSHIPAAERLTRLLKKLGWNGNATVTTHQKPNGMRDKLTRSLISGLVGVTIGATIVAMVSNLEATRGESKNCPQTQDIRIKLSPHLQWGNLAQLLRKLQLQVVSGPNQDGEIWLHLDKEPSISETIVLLRNSPGIEQAIPTNTGQTANACRP